MKSHEGVTTEKLNEAYQALEKMRKMNLEVTCGEVGIPYDATRCDGQCTTCLLQRSQDKEAASQSRFPRLREIVNDVNKEANTNKTAFQRFPRIRKMVNERQKSPPCLICGSPVCRSHSSASFRKENITVCNECEQLFELDFVIDCLTESTPQARRVKMDHMVDSYDRALLLLHYSCQYIDQVATSLEESTKTQNKVGLGSSATGILSGALGVVAAATILTPAGPPLLIASLLFGGSATAVQTGTEAMNYFSEPNQLADRVIALHGVLMSILNITGVLRDAMLRDHIRSDHYEPNNKKDVLTKAIRKNRASLLGGLAVGRYGMAGVEISRVASAAETGAVAGRNARFFSRTGTNLMRTARFARFAGGALSAAILVLEAKSMSNTIQAMQSGNPCEKAERLRNIRDEISELPDTASLDREIESYLQAMIDRQRAMTQEEVTKILVEQSEAALAEAKQLQLLEEDEKQLKSPVVGNECQGTSILDGEEDTITTTTASSSSPELSMSLLERIELFKQRDSEDVAESEVQAVSTKSSDSTEASGDGPNQAAVAIPTSSVPRPTLSFTNNNDAHTG